MIVESLIEIAKKLSTEDKSLSLGVFSASRRVPFEKYPGSRPIGAGEVFRRVFFGKYTVSIVRNVIISFVGSMQVLAGHKTGCQAAIHAMHTILDYAVLLIDASNVLNSIYREVHLNYIFLICPAIAT